MNIEIRTCLYDFYRRHKIQIFIYCDCKAKLNFFNSDVPYATIHRTRGGQHIKKTCHTRTSDTQCQQKKLLQPGIFLFASKSLREEKM